MRNGWSLTLSGKRTPRSTQLARGMFLRRSKVWRNGRDGSYTISDRTYPTKKVAELEIPSSLGRNLPSNDYVIALAGPPDGIDSVLLHEDTHFRTVYISYGYRCHPLQAVDLVQDWISILQFGSTAPCPRTHRMDQLTLLVLELTWLGIAA